MENIFATAYPHLARWVEAFGWLELGQDDYSSSVIRILDTGGLIWESEDQYDSLDAALREAEAALVAWSKQEGIELDA